MEYNPKYKTVIMKALGDPIPCREVFSRGKEIKIVDIHEKTIGRIERGKSGPQIYLNDAAGESVALLIIKEYGSTLSLQLKIKLRDYKQLDLKMIETKALQLEWSMHERLMAHERGETLPHYPSARAVFQSHKGQVIWDDSYDKLKLLDTRGGLFVVGNSQEGIRANIGWTEFGPNVELFILDDEWPVARLWPSDLDIFAAKINFSDPKYPVLNKDWGVQVEFIERESGYSLTLYDRGSPYLGLTLTEGNPFGMET